MFFLFSLFLRTKNCFQKQESNKLGPVWFSRNRERNIQVKGLFGSYFLKLFLRTIFENTKNTIIVSSENFSYSLDLLFSVFFLTVKKKEPNMFCMFFLFFLFLGTKNCYQKQEPNK